MLSPELRCGGGQETAGTRTGLQETQEPAGTRGWLRCLVEGPMGLLDWLTGRSGRAGELRLSILMDYSLLIMSRGLPGAIGVARRHPPIFPVSPPWRASEVEQGFSAVKGQTVAVAELPAHAFGTFRSLA